MGRLLFAIAVLVAVSTGAGSAPACVTVVNSANGWYPVELRAGGALAIHRVDVGPARQLCLPLELAADRTLEVRVKSFMGPIGSCKSPPGATVQIVRVKGEDGDVTRVDCS